jgi:hypothetical protein
LQPLGFFFQIVVPATVSLGISVLETEGCSSIADQASSTNGPEGNPVHETLQLFCKQQYEDAAHKKSG